MNFLTLILLSFLTVGINADCSSNAIQGYYITYFEAIGIKGYWPPYENYSNFLTNVLKNDVNAIDGFCGNYNTLTKSVTDNCATVTVFNSVFGIGNSNDSTLFLVDYKTNQYTCSNVDGYKKKFNCDKTTDVSACKKTVKDACSNSAVDTCVLKTIGNQCSNNAKDAAFYGCNVANVALNFYNCAKIDCSQFNIASTNTVLQCFTPYFANLGISGNPPLYSVYQNIVASKLNSNVNFIDDFCEQFRTLAGCVTDTQAVANSFNDAFGTIDGPNYLMDYKSKQFTCNNIAGYKLLFKCTNQTKTDNCKQTNTMTCDVASEETCILKNVKNQCDNDAAIFGCRQANVDLAFYNCSQIDCNQFNSGFSNFQFAFVSFFIAIFSHFFI